MTSLSRCTWWQLVWTTPPSGKVDENFRIGIANCAAVCVCLSADYHLSAKCRTEVTYATESSKLIVVLVGPCLAARRACWSAKEARDEGQR